jgi:hypothetical protein
MCAGCEEEQQEKGSVLRSAEAGASRVAAPRGDVVPPGGGRPLDSTTRDYFAMRFGRDFGDVRVHTDGSADAAARGLRATAYTTGRDIVFRQGAYAPESSSGRRLLAHELTHVVQQERGSVTATQPFSVSEPHDEAEREADRVASAVTGSEPGELPPMIGAAPGATLSRHMEEEEEGATGGGSHRH